MALKVYARVRVRGVLGEGASGGCGSGRGWRRERGGSRRWERGGDEIGRSNLSSIA